MTAAQMWAQARRQPLLVGCGVLLCVSALLSAGAGRMAYAAQQSTRRQVADNEAQRCIDDWETVMEVRRAIPIPGEAIVEVASDADPEQVEQFRAAVDRRIEEAFPNPDCDLDAARAQLNN